MKTAVLCVELNQVLAHSEIDPRTAGVYPLELSDIPADAYQFLNRKIVDTKAAAGLDYDIAQAFPQLLVYITVQDKETGEYLSYSRGNTGGESRLADMRSIGLGGHTDIEDLITHSDGFINVAKTLDLSASRELAEEIKLQYVVGLPSTVQVIADMTNPVSAVHLGVWINVQVYRKTVHSTAESQDIQWLEPEQLLGSIGQYEPWSQLLIKQIQKDK